MELFLTFEKAFLPKEKKKIASKWTLSKIYEAY
jgi:hypothetical protein